MASLSKPREAALRALVACDKDGAYLNISLRDILAASCMDERDRALAQALAMGTMKHRLFIDNIIKKLSSVKPSKLSVWIYNILRIGIFSLKFMDRIPESATVNECVRLARRYGHSASAGFVNAILRNACKKGDFLPEDKTSAEYLSIKYSYPLWLTEKWLREGYDEAFFKGMNDEPPVTVRINTLKAASLPEEFEKSSLSPYTYTYTGGGSVEYTDAFKEGLISVQDGASQLAVLAMNIKKDMRVLDLCAAPGGKTAFIAQLLENSGEVVACDIHAHKLELIEANLKRLGITNTRIMENDASKPCADFKEAFDRVLIDAPCSGLGVLRRKPDIKWTKSEMSNEELVKIQRSILSAGAEYVKKGGLLLYSTCTVSRAENEENVKFFLESFPEFSLCDEFKDSLGKQLLPHKDETDGFFFAAFERN